MRVLNFTIIKLTVCLIIGIIISCYINSSLNTLLYITGMLFVILLIAFFIARKQFTKTSWFGLFAFLLAIFVGILITNLHNPKNFPNHYTNHILKDKSALKTITFKVRDVLKPSNYHNKYIIDILHIDNNKAKGKLLLNIQKDTTKSSFKVDDIYTTRTELKDLTPPLNPHEFNYKSYLERQYIYHQCFITKQSLLKISSHTHTVFGIANNIRAYINSKLKSYHFKTEELAVINALLLGQRQDISDAMYTSYINAGAIHILAVSGLHVGIILLILSFILKPLEYYKHGKLIKTILLVSFLWSFALIAGLSASVTRAVTMFSIVTIALNLKRPTNIYNTLALSMFIILPFKPLFLFNVGFQLSYLAVFSIVLLDPILFKLWQPRNKIINFYWHTFTITVSAQIGIIPISLYYFHQFPGLFFISNLVIIPFLGLILGLGVLVILLASLNLLPQCIADSYGHIINWMNRFIHWVSKQESFLFKDISFSLLYVITAYLLIISSIKLFKKWNYINLKLALIAIIILQGSMIYTNYKKPNNEFIIFHKNRHSLIGNIGNSKITVSHDFDSITTLKNHIIKDYTVKNHISTIKKDTFQSVYILHNKTLLVIDSIGAYNIKSFKPDYLLLRQSPKINLNRLIDSIKPKCIIADGSNYKSHIKQWEGISRKRKLPFHQTSKKGAFIITY